MFFSQNSKKRLLPLSSILEVSHTCTHKHKPQLSKHHQEILIRNPEGTTTKFKGDTVDLHLLVPKLRARFECRINLRREKGSNPHKSPRIQTSKTTRKKRSYQFYSHGAERKEKISFVVYTNRRNSRSSTHQPTKQSYERRRG